MLEKIKLLLGLSDTDDKDELIQTIVSLCKDEAIDYCNLTEYTSKLDSAVIQMVIERYNRLGTEGLNSSSSSGINEQYLDTYSNAVIRKLQKNRKVKCV